MYPVLFSLGPFTVYSFGVMMAAGFYFGSMAAVSEFRRRGGDGDKMWNYLVWVFVAGLLGSRLLSLTNDLAALARNPLQALLSGAGFVWYGGLLMLGIGTPVYLIAGLWLVGRDLRSTDPAPQT